MIVLKIYLAVEPELSHQLDLIHTQETGCFTAYYLLPDAKHSARLAIDGSSSSLISRCEATRTLCKMITLSIRRFLTCFFLNESVRLLSRLVRENPVFLRDLYHAK